MTIYGRYGSRSQRENADKDIAIEGFVEAMEAALELHKNYPANKTALTGKQSPPPRFNVPQDYPSLNTYQPAIDYAGKVARGCIHCHQVRDAERVFLRKRGEALPDEVVYPFPMPDVVGLALDPRKKATVTSVRENSPAASAAFKAGDDIVRFEGQPMLSVADVQWVLHNAKAPGTLHATVRRGGQEIELPLRLAADWRRSSDIAWRTTTWDFRRMALGGLVLEDLDDDARTSRGLPQAKMALRVKYVGQYNEHAAGKRAGFQVDDVITRVDDQSTRMTEAGLLRHLLQNKPIGTRVKAGVLRGGQQLELELPMQ
jgi:serine protease Do